MSRTENVELTVLCMLYKENEILLQNRVKNDWRGYTFPGGHIENGESVVSAVIREMREETGLKVKSAKLCGIKQFPIIDNGLKCGRYLVFLFKSDDFSGELSSSEEGEVCWVDRKNLKEYNLVEDFFELLKVFDDDNLTEFQYNDDWSINVL